MLSTLVAVVAVTCPPMGYSNAPCVGPRLSGAALSLSNWPYAPTGTSPFFEFAPVSGVGMGAPCAGTTPTGSKGEVLTFTRASDASCTKGNETSLIANGDLITVTSGQPRVMPGGDGSGGLGLSVWEARTSVALRSKEFDHAAWITWNNVGILTRTANYAVDPWGDLAADRLQFNATNDAQYSSIYQAVTGTTTGVASGAVYVKGTSASGTMDLAVYNPVGVDYVCVTCAFNPTTWTRCLDENVTVANLSTSYIIMGNLSHTTYCGTAGSSRSAIDVLLSQADYQRYTTMSPPIVVVGTPVTRIVSVPSMPAGTFTGPTISVAATWVAPSIFTAGATAFQLQKDANNDTKGYATSTGATSTFTCDFRIGGVSSTVATAGNLTVSAANRVACYYDGTNKAACLNSTCTTSAVALTLPTGAMTMWLGTRSATGNEAQGTIKRVCGDPSPGRCI